MDSRDKVIEDCDMIYARAVFTTSPGSTTVIGCSDPAANSSYSDGTLNTGQPLVFRTFRVTDPRPV